MKNKRRLKILALTFLATFTSATLVTSTIAWFKYGASISFGGETGGDPKLKAGVETFYYAGGTGTQNDPYIISNRTHLYNLAWLQYIGTYNTPSIQQKYFEIQLPEGTTSLDMSGITLPPIGTDTYPFLGNFNGNGYTISNLMVCNDDPKEAGSAFGSAKPNVVSIPNEAVPPEVIGFFGVVGKLPTQDITYNSSIVSVSNVVLNNLTVTCKTTKTLIGLAAGYIDGVMSGVRVSGNAKLDLGTGSKQIVSSNITNNISDYGLVGYSAQAQESVFTQELSKYYANDDPTHGGDDWGGSLHIGEYMRWMYRKFLDDGCVVGSTMETNSNMGTSFGDGTRINTINSSNNARYHAEFNVENPSNKKNEIKSGTKYTYYLNPDTFDDPPYGSMNNTGSTYMLNYVKYTLRENTIIPFKFNSDNSAEWSDVYDNNSGYIVGYTSTGSAGNYNSPQFTSHYYDAITNSLSDTYVSRNYCESNKNIASLPTAIEVVGFDSSSNYALIKDSYNSNHTVKNAAIKQYSTISSSTFKRYDDARAQLAEYLYKNDPQNKGDRDIRLQALRFERKEISTNNTASFNVKLDGENLSNYEMPLGSLDFRLKKDGYISLFAGSYHPQRITYMSFFSLYHVERNGNSISSLKRISEIYSNTATNPSPKYFYKYSDNTYSGTGTTTKPSNCSTNPIYNVHNTLEKEIQVNITSAGTLNNCLFYFEIPVNEGEYAMGMVPGYNSDTKSGASLLYLDLGTDGAGDNNEKITGYNIKTTIGGLKFPVGVDFEVVGTTGTSGIKSGGVSFCVQVDAGASGNTTFTITSTNVTLSSPSIASKYSFKGSAYTTEASPPSGKFKVTNGPNGSLTEVNQVTRVSHIKIGNISEILVTDVLNGISITSTKYTYNGNEYTSNDNNSGPVIPPAITTATSLFTKDVVSTIRGQTTAVSLARDNSGAIVTFNSVLPALPWGTSTSNFDNVYNVTINSYPAGLRIRATRSSNIYGLKVNTSAVSFNDNNEGAYPLA